MNYYVIYGLVFAIVLYIVRCCGNVLKRFKDFPVSHLVPYGFYCQIFRKIPEGLPLSSFVLKILVEDCLKFSKEGLCMLYLFEPMLVIFNEDTVKVFSNEKAAESKPALYHQLATDIFGQGLVLNSGEKWKKHRKIFNPAFNLRRLKERIPLFNVHAEAFVKHLETMVDKDMTELIDIIKLHYFNSLLESVFGFKQTEENNAEKLKFFHNCHILAESTIYRLTHPWLVWKFLLMTFSRGRQILHTYKELSDFIRNLILKMEADITAYERMKTENLSENLVKSLTYMLLKHYQTDPSFTLEDMINECRTFMLTGYESISNSTMWCLYNLGLYPEIQEKVYNEIHFTLTKDYVTFDDCSSFSYLEAVILETFRLYPTIPIFARKLTEDVLCGQRKVPKGTLIGFLPYVLHRNPDVYPDPEKFDPDRFLGNGQNPGAYIPFAEGYRNCIGKKYALLEMKVFLAHFLRHFKITSLTKREDIELCWSIMLMPDKPLRMKIERR